MTEYKGYYDDASRMKAFPAQLEIDNVTPATLLLEKRRQMVEVQKSLNDQKEEYQLRELEFQKREQNLRKRDLDLQENLVQFNKFLKDKAEKRNQYLKKTEKERQEKQQKLVEIRNKKEELNRLKMERSKLELQFKSLEIYENYLEKVKSEHEDYPEIESILKRHKVLSDAEADLTQKESDSAQGLDNLRLQMQEFIEEKNTYFLSLNNEQNRLVRELEEVQQGTATLQAELQNLVSKEQDQAKDWTEICMATNNILQRSKKIFCSNRMKPDDFNNKNLQEAMESRLRLICRNIEDGHIVLESLQKEGSAKVPTRRRTAI